MPPVLSTANNSNEDYPFIYGTTSESQEELFIILMKSKETAVIKALGKYIDTAFKIREEHMSLL